MWALALRLSIIVFSSSVLAAWWSDRVARELGANLAWALSGFLEAAHAPSTQVDDEASAGKRADPAFNDEVEPASGREAGVPPEPKRRAARQVRLARTPEVVATFHVPAAKVLEVAESGRPPHGRPEGGTAGHPPGVRVFGASGRGLPVQDGDVLTHVAGQPVGSISDVASIVLSLRGQGVKTISGIFWRGDQAFAVLVDQPYFENAAATSP